MNESFKSAQLNKRIAIAIYEFLVRLLISAYSFFNFFQCLRACHDKIIEWLIHGYCCYVRIKN